MAVDSLLERHLPGLRAYLRLNAGGLIRGQESCSDLAQSVCREVLQDLDGFEWRGEAAFRHWLFKTAERKVIDRHRFYTRAKRDVQRNVTEEALHAPEQLAATYARMLSPGEQAELREQIGQLEGCFDELPDDYREVILLFHVVGLSHREVAERMERSEAATRNLLSRALARLARLLRRERGDA